MPPPRPFKDQRDLDRFAIKKMLNKVAIGPKFKQMTRKDREDLVKETVRVKWAQREACVSTTTVRQEYAEQFDEQEEMRHYLHYVSTRFGPPSEDEQHDDPEDRFVLLGLRNIKKEVKYDEESVADSESEDDGVEATSDEQSDDAEDEPEDEPVCVVVRREFVIQNSKQGVGSFGLRVGASKNAKLKASSLAERIEPRGIVKQQLKKSAKRAWKWVDGKMVVWPPFETVA